MEKKSAEEFMGMKGHDFGVAGITIIFPAERDVVIGDSSQAVVRDGDAVGVTAEITKDMVGSAKGWFGVDDPVGRAETVEKRSEGFWLFEWGEATMEGEFSLGMKVQEPIQKHTAEEAGQDPHRQKEVGRRLDPAGSVVGETAGGDKAVNVGMKQQILAPGVKKRDKTDVGAEMFGIGGDGGQG